MKTSSAVILLFSSLCLQAQTINITEVSNEELKEYLKVNANDFQENQERYYEAHRMNGFQFIIYYEDKAIYSGDILKPRFQGSSSFTNHNFNTSRVLIDFLVPIDEMDKETALELRANEMLRLLTSDSGKNYVYPSGGWLLYKDDYKTKKIERFETLAPKVTIKIYSTTLSD